ncbi:MULTISPECIES: SIS domain-containing protein [Methylobacterium]|uniref:Phosphoheptose isomerase n=1 Tax=Methylobacterium jeotgali TaxID=381630 RepID=A0ABQ4STK7_9HYPH|nr:MULTISPECIES: SIS domain-containing protein [Methylobacterium]PIU05845.1 MAG: phosphoheptose isomerase [Methylobacterium sp. CG09_land_8_20_14_0_10_71_15]PIU13254.1 MAG: phosphoheptose isomerase [Methylobacterium sp. CG08_land_8_20_14_0_20_71_15]GBU19092.1 phosphoheptose isomerase [Methylobacterium sp.]GJE06447.1 Phosphoheptose isomerase [Methylobacterium jeotgali]
MEWNSWLDDYYARYQAAIFDPAIRGSLEAFHALCLDVRANGRKLMFAGNGASASIASHGAVDFTKQAKVRGVDFNEPNLITAYSNDFGFENFMAKAVEHHGDAGDGLVLISVSGRSQNAVNAARTARERGIKVVSFTGAKADNPLREVSDIAFWCDSKAYNIVECTHMIWLTTVVDMLVGKAEYSVS